MFSLLPLIIIIFNTLNAAKIIRNNYKEYIFNYKNIKMHSLNIINKAKGNNKGHN